MFVPFIIYLLVSFAIWYLYALYSDRLKAHRHNGIAIVYEYPHPASIGERPALLNVGSNQMAKALVTTVSIVVMNISNIVGLSGRQAEDEHVRIICRELLLSGALLLALVIIERAFLGLAYL